MDKQTLSRINELAAKKRESGLTDEELEEQRRLYSEYLGEIRARFGSVLGNVSVRQPDGSVEPFDRAFKKTDGKTRDK